MYDNFPGDDDQFLKNLFSSADYTGNVMKRSLLIAAAACSAMAATAGRGAAPVIFLPNQGEAPPDVRFLARGSGATGYFSAGEALFQVRGATLRVQFDGAEPSAEVQGVERLSGEANFLVGPEEEWRLGVPVYGGITYRGLYPGIDMLYGANGRNLKSEFVVAPGADPFRIRIRYVGAGALRLAPDGALIIPVGESELREEAPRIYQERGGRRARVEGRFSIAGDTVGFQIDDYDRSVPLVIDPVLYSTLLGGASSDAATAVAVDASGSAYVAGFTASYDFPTVNPKQNYNAGGNEVFVAKLNPAGNGLVYCTYLGGSGDDRAYGIALGADGSAYVTGVTASRNFPVANALQSSLAGAKNAFVLKLNPAGNALVFSTYLGGAGSDSANAIAVDAGGNVYVAGDTTSTTFPVTGLQTAKHGSQDAFAAKLAGDGSRLLYGTYLGGANDDHAAAIAVDSSGTAYITGSTYSPDFPVAQAWQNHLGGGQDAFVARLSADGGSLLFSTYLGGTGGALGYPEIGQGIALDAQGNAYVTGVTASVDFPLLGPAQASLRGSLDAFAAKLNSSGTLVYSTYLGGTSLEAGNAIAVDAAGMAYIAGQTYSSDLPVVNAFQSASGGGYDAFVARLAATGDSVLFLSYLGGNGSDTATSIALDSSSNIYLAGWTLSTNFPAVNGYQSVNAGTYGAFVTKFGSVAPAPPGVVGVTPAAGSGSSQTFAFQFSDSQGAAHMSSVSVLFNSSLSTVSACSITYNPAANTLALLTDAGAAPAGTITPGSGSQQNSQCTLSGAGSSVSISGNVLTLNLALAFQSTFVGSQSIYLQAASPDGSTGWCLGGSWTVPAPASSPVSVTPASGSGDSQTFAFLFNDPQGYAGISTASMIINSSISGAASCYLYYVRASNAIYLANDAGTAWMTGLTPGQTGTVQNSQCSINAAGSSFTASGTSLTVNLALTFLPAYNGPKNIYMLVYDGQSSGWLQKGTYTVNAASNPFGPVSVTPGSGSGGSQTFALVFADPKGASAISSASVIVGASAAAASTCYVYFSSAANTIYLANDAGTAWLAPVRLGQAGTLQNSQCAVNAAGSSSSADGNNLTLNLALTFLPAYNGAKNIYMLAYDGQSSGWQQKGTWTVSATTGTLGPVSVTPASGSGGSQTFAFLYTDPNGGGSVYSASIVIGATSSGVGSCYLYYLRSANSLYLANDAGDAWLAPMTLGQAGTLQNSQCSVNMAASSSSTGGNNLALNLALSFLYAFNGDKNIYMEVYDTQDSGWQQKGAWTVNATPVMGPVSVTPAAGSGSSQAFSFAFYDPKGASSIASASMIVGTTASGIGSCYLYYLRSSNSLYLANDAATAWLPPLVLGQSGTLQNSQCSADVAASSSSASGNNLTLTLSLTFKSVYSGSKKIYAMLYDGQNSGWVQKGTWSIP
jgi:Beta-propeller repeat